jgi:hypothetical protein
MQLLTAVAGIRIGARRRSRSARRLRGRNSSSLRLLRSLARWRGSRCRLLRTLTRRLRSHCGGLGSRYNYWALIRWVGRTTRRLFAITLTTLFLFARSLLRDAACLFLRLLFRGLFFNAAAIIHFEAFALETLGLDARSLTLHGLLGLATLLIYFVLLQARFFLQHIALDIGALGANFHVNRARATLHAGELDLALRLSLQRDLARRGVTIVPAAVTTAQVGEQLELRVIADAIVGTRHLDTRLIELHEQPIDGYLEDVGEL